MTFEELYDLYFKDIYRFSYWLTGNSFDAKDITSETFIRAWTRFTFIKTETLKGYLLKIAHNLFIDQIREKKRFGKIDEYRQDPSPSQESNAEVLSELKWIYDLLAKFPETDQAAFILRVEQELSYDEIARILDISESSAKVKVHRIRKKLIAVRNIQGV